MGESAKLFAEGTVDAMIFGVVTLTDKSLEVPGDLKNTYWIQAFTWGNWDHPKYGDVNIDQEFASRLIQNFRDNAYGQELPIDYDHGIDPSKGLQAAAWVKDMRSDSDGIYYLLEFTDDALSEIKSGKYRYFSPMFYSHWDNGQGKQFEDIAVGGALTNRPYFKGMLPLNFSEIVATPEELLTWRNEMVLEFATLTAAQRDALPDSSYLYIGPDGTKHWPYKDKNGKLDRDHLVAASRLIPRTQGVPESAKTEALAKVKRLLGNQEHSEGEGMTEEQLALLRKFAEVLGIELPETFTEEEALAKFSEKSELIKPLEKAKEDANKQLIFREQFPQEYAELQRSKEFRIATDAKEFAEQYSRFTLSKADGTTVEDTRGFSALALEKIEGLHREFSEGKATEATLKDVLDTVANGGIVDFKEYGSSRTPSGEYTAVADLTDVKGVRKAFGELVQSFMVEDSVTYADAINEAAKKDPELFTAYQSAGMGG